jgi:hypothetical protein
MRRPLTVQQMAHQLGEHPQGAEQPGERGALADLDQVGVEQCLPHRVRLGSDHGGNLIRHVVDRQELLSEHHSIPPRRSPRLCVIPVEVVAGSAARRRELDDPVRRMSWSYDLVLLCDRMQCGVEEADDVGFPGVGRGGQALGVPGVRHDPHLHGGW